MGAKKGTPAIAAGIVSLFLISMGMSYIQVIMPGLYERFSDIPASTVTYLMSMTPLAGIFGGLAAGALVARRLVGYKPLAILGTVLFFVGGTAPVFVHDFAFIMVARCVLGVGMGFMSVLGNPLVSAFFEGDAKTKLLSACSAAGQIGAMVMQLLSGLLADLDFWWAFAADAVAVLSIIGAVFLVKEPAPEDLPRQEGRKGALPARVWYVAALMFVATLAIMPLLFNFALVVARYSTSAALASTVQISYTVAMILGGLAYALVVKAFKRLTLGFASIVAAVGMLVFVTANGLPVVYAGMFVTGLGYSLFIPAALQIVGLASKPTLIAFGTSVAMGAMNVASFAVSPYLGIIEWATGDAIFTPMWIGVGVFVVLALVNFAASPYPREEAELPAAGEEAA